MYFYRIKNKTAFSFNKYMEFDEITESLAMKENGILYFLTKLDKNKSRRSFSISDPSLLFLEKEDLSLLSIPEKDYEIKEWIKSKIVNRQVMAINTSYHNWDELLEYTHPKKWKVNIVGLGDVGGILLTGLRLLGGDCISEIGIYSRTKESALRWEMEANQILRAFDDNNLPIIKCIDEDDVFNCDMFVFCASKSVPKIGENVGDVRLYQFKDNAKIMKIYAQKLREKNFKGIFAVVSDPVDLLCKVALVESNKNEQGDTDYKGLAPEQIRGYGLGVMNARAAYYASKMQNASSYKEEGRAYGPHGEGLVIANSIENYDDELSRQLTEKVLKANLEVRKTGFKPFIAPALSSGALSIIDTIKGNWHYSATYIGGVYMGAKNRLLASGTELERLNIPNLLLNRIEKTYDRLEKII